MFCLASLDIPSHWIFSKLSATEGFAFERVIGAVCGLEWYLYNTFDMPAQQYCYIYLYLYITSTLAHQQEVANLTPMFY